MPKIDLGKVVGEDAKITIGTTTTLDAGNDATVENVGTKSDAVLNFGIPKGYTPIKGTDYWTENDIDEIHDYVDEQISAIDLTPYSEKTETGHSIELSINAQTYVITATLKNVSGDVLNTQTIDLPLETMVVGGSYDSATKEVVLTLQSGSTIRFSVSDLVDGLVSESDLEVTLADYVSRETFDSIVGDLDDLSTEDKTTLVNAINEVVTNMGDLSIKELQAGTYNIDELDDGIYIQEATRTIKLNLPRRSDGHDQGEEYVQYDLLGILIKASSVSDEPSIMGHYIFTTMDESNNYVMTIVQGYYEKFEDPAGVEEPIIIGEYETTYNTSKKYTNSVTGDLANLDTTDKTNLVSAINEIASSGGGSDVPIYILNTTNNLRDSNGTQFLGNDEKTRYGEIITDAYVKGYKRIAIMLCSTNSGKSYMFYSNSDIATNISPSFYADASFNDRNDMNYIVRRNLNGPGTWSNDEFTVTSTLTYDAERRLIVHSTNSVAYTPTPNSYNPATTKYVDDAVASAGGGGSKTYVIEDYTKDWITDSESIAKFNSWYQDYLNNIPSNFIIRTRMQDTINYGSVTKTFLLEQFDMISNAKLMLFSSYEGANPTKRYYFQISLTITNNEVTAIVASTGSAVNGIGPKLTSAYQPSGSNAQFALTTDNTKSYTPTGDYNPSTKLYTDTTAERTILTKSGLSVYSTSTTYQVGDYVYRSADFTIYKCNTADTTGTWDASKWDSKTYIEYLSDTLIGGALNGSY